MMVPLSAIGATTIPPSSSSPQCARAREGRSTPLLKGGGGSTEGLTIELLAEPPPSSRRSRGSGVTGIGIATTAVVAISGATSLLLYAVVAEAVVVAVEPVVLVERSIVRCGGRLGGAETIPKGPGRAVAYLIGALVLSGGGLGFIGGVGFIGAAMVSGMSWCC